MNVGLIAVPRIETVGDQYPAVSLVARHVVRPASIEAIAPAYLGNASIRSRFNAFRTTARR